MIFHVNKYGKPNKEYTMVILTEDDIETKKNNPIGFGYEILVLPAKYKNINTPYLEVLRSSPVFRGGKIIYV
jgi:hypothetical protein